MFNKSITTIDQVVSKTIFLNTLFFERKDDDHFKQKEPFVIFFCKTFFKVLSLFPSLHAAMICFSSSSSL